MIIGVTSQNFRTITGHAGKARRFLVYQVDVGKAPVELERIDLPKEMSMHENKSANHPIDDLDVLITAGCGDGFVRKMSVRNIRLVLTSETNPLVAVKAVIEGKPLATADPVAKKSCH